MSLEESFERTTESSGQAFSLAGTWGRAFAGGALSGPVSKSTCNQGRESSEPLRRDSIRRDLIPRISVQQPSPKLETQCIDSPSLSDPGDHTSYNPSDECLSAQTASPSPNSPAPHQNVSSTESLRPTPRSGARTSDTSLPVEEESEDRVRALRHELEVRDLECEHNVASPSTPSSPHSRPGAPIPPSPYSYTSAVSLSPSLLVSGMSRTEGKKPILPPYNPAPRVDSPYPYPFAHIRRRSHAGSIPDDGNIGISQVELNVIHEQLSPTLNREAMASNLTLSPSSTSQYDPWRFIQTNNALGGRPGVIANSQASTHSSPSHQPVPLPPSSRGIRRRRRYEHSQDLRRQSKTHPPPRIESTQPRDTSPELSPGKETPSESKDSEPDHSAHRPALSDESGYDEDEADADGGEWIDEDMGTEGVAGDLLQLEFHPDYVRDPKKRRRRWDFLWDSLLRYVSAPSLRDHPGRFDPVIWSHDSPQFHALDRETNTPLMLLAQLHLFTLGSSIPSHREQSAAIAPASLPT